ncbi:MAG: AP2 domain protein [Syntrophorhabdus sp. PtaU1.Bin153]|nr:MAG: AP2 domain protein [Syntrophorhabdus sp. PtaU1.Bin153]
MIEIPLSRGKIALIDDEDYALISPYKWWASKDRSGKLWYATTTLKIQEKWGHMKMHRLILGAPLSMDVDHCNHDGLDNRRQNLRICSRTENNRNQRPLRGGTSIFKGVHFSRDTGSWAAQISKGGGPATHLGLFATEVEAAEAYNRAAVEFYGEFAEINHIPEGICPIIVCRTWGTSKYRGVSWDRKKRKWVSLIQHKHKVYFLGQFDDEVEAAIAYDKAARHYKGHMAKLNFPKMEMNHE